MVLRSLQFQKLFSHLRDFFKNGINIKISSVKSIVSPNPHDEHQDFVALGLFQVCLLQLPVCQ